MSNDHPSPWSLAGHQQGWPPAPGQAPPSQGYAPEPPPAPPQLAPFVAPHPIEVRLLGHVGAGRGLAVTGVVLGAAALLAALLALLVALFAFGVGADPGPGTYGLRGTLAPVKGVVAGTALADEVSRKITEDGGVPEGLACPVEVKVAQDVTAVCHGTDYGDPATFVVFFEDARGAYTLLEV
ncbi:hypothetical protein [Microlunatus flavus]|uniref:DUF4333 domain-containing protein n=1 Tax=Microlunatus flavus TaxID=1036181 RepID=A0A1H9CCE3_9ACTN|nr:hypothetical protein [Microlunatus flavus]SEP98677.1 hypothetical protein SAMN05421756_102152 [Microlunatus flavus]